MRISLCSVMVAVTAVVVTMLLAAPANAATGLLVLRGPGSDVVITDPVPGCRSVTAGFAEVVNRTTVDVTVHHDSKCAGYGLVVRRGSTGSVGDRHSIRIPY